MSAREAVQAERRAILDAIREAGVVGFAGQPGGGELIYKQDLIRLFLPGGRFEVEEDE